MSRFEGIRKARQPGKQQPASPDSQPTDDLRTQVSSESDQQVTESADIQQVESSRTQPKRRYRPRGKRSNPDYEQVSAYIPKTLYRQVKLKLLEIEDQPGQPSDFSELVADLLGDWLEE